MSIGRTARGTAKSAASTPGGGFIAKSGVACGAGSTLVVAVVYGNSANDIVGVTWNGHAMTKKAEQAQTDSGASKLDVWVYQNASSGTGNVVIDDGSGLDGYALAITEVTGAATASFDKTAASYGTDTSPLTTNTATTSQANEMLLAFVGWEVAVPSGSWGGSFSAGQSIGDATMVGIEEGYRSVTATGAYGGSMTGAPNTNWMAVITTFKEAVSAQISTPARVLVTGTAIAALAVAGAVSCTPSRVTSSVTARAPVSVPGAVHSTPTRVGATALALDGTARTNQTSAVQRVAVSASAIDVALVRRNSDPGIDTVLATLVNGASTPTVLRGNTVPYYDQSTATYYSVASTLGPGSGTLTFGVGSMAVTVQGVGAISGVKFYAMARTRADSHFAVTSGTAVLVSTSAAFTALPPSGPYSAVPQFGTISTGTITTSDGTHPWDWSTIAGALTGVSLAFGYTNGAPYSDFGQVDVAEVWCEVYGPIGTGSVLVPVHSRMGLPGTVSRVQDTFTGGD